MWASAASDLSRLIYRVNDKPGPSNLSGLFCAPPFRPHARRHSADFSGVRLRRKAGFRCYSVMHTIVSSGFPDAGGAYDAEVEKDNFEQYIAEKADVEKDGGADVAGATCFGRCR